MINVSLDHQVHNGWSMDHQGLPPVDLFLAADADAAMRRWLQAIGPAATRPADAAAAHDRPGPERAPHEAWRRRCARRSAHARVAAAPAAVVARPAWPFRHPLDFIGGDGGGGIGGGPGIAVGAALALTDRAGCRSRSAATAIS